METRNILAEIFVSNFYPTLINECYWDTFKYSLLYDFNESWSIPKIDAFLNSFLTTHLISSKDILESLNQQDIETFVSLYLKAKSTQLERAQFLIEQMDKRLILNSDVQRIILRTPKYRSLIDQLLQDDKILTVDKLLNDGYLL